MATITVTNLNDTGNGSLRQAIAIANPGDTIDFAPSLAGGTLTLTSGELDIASNVTIEGDIDHNGTPDITISGGGNSRVFEVNNGITADFDGLVITDGNAVSGTGAQVQGGGLRVDDSANVTVTDSTLADNDAKFGGAVANYRGTLTLADTTLSGNTALFGGGIYSDSRYGALGNVTAINTTVSGNSATYDGGGAYFVGPSRQLSLINSTVSGNAAGNRGGGVYTDVLTLTNSIVAGNSASNAGNDVGDRGTLTAVGNNIVGSAPLGATFDTTNGSFTQIDGTSQTDLQTVFAHVGNDPHTNVLSGVLANNGGGVDTIALNSTGIAIDAGVSGDRPQDTLDLNHNGNTAELLPVDARDAARVVGASVDIGAFEAQATPTDLVVTTLNDETYDGGDIVAETADGNGLSLREALTLADAAGGSHTITFDPSLSGGTLTLTNGELDIASNVTIEGDIDHNGTPDITISGGGSSRIFEVDSSGTSTLDGLVLTGGQTANNGGAVFVDSGASLMVTDSTLHGNSAYDGGGVYVRSGAVLTLYNSTLTDNSAAAIGGGIVSLGGLTLVNSTLSGNSAVFGGGVYNNGTFALVNSTLSGNSAAANGKGGGIMGGGGTLTLTNATLSGNSAGGGGGIYAKGTLTLANATLSGNYAAAFGGGIDAVGTVTLTNDTLSGNSAKYMGGGIYYRGSTTLANSIVAGNVAGLGSDLYGSVNYSPSLTLNGGNIVGGTSSVDGTTSQTGIALNDIFASVAPNSYTHVSSGVLANNGGPVETIALNASASNPAIDAGDDALAPATDARGFARSDFAGAANNGANISDLGAFEVSHQIVVTTLDDVTQPSGGLVSLREAIGLANAAGGSNTITFDPSLAGGTLTLSHGELDITSDVTIDGDIDGNGTPDIAVDGNNASRVFAAQAGSSTLDGLAIADGSADFGGGLRVYGGASVNVTNSTIAGNTASNSGGGLYVARSAYVTVTDAALSVNSASQYGGAIYSTFGTLSLTNTTLSGNGAGASGGAIYTNHSGLTAINTTVSGNSAAVDGGGIASTFGQESLINSTVSGNASGDNGGGFFLTSYGSLVLTNSVMAGNAAASGNDVYTSGAQLFAQGNNILGSAPDGTTFDTTNGSYTTIDGTSAAALGTVFAHVGHDPYTGVLSGTLAYNGGPVATVALNPTGIAVDAGVTAAAVFDDDNNPATSDVPIPTDARGFSRVAGSSVDIGAFEQQAAQSFVVTTLNDELDSTNPNATIADMGGPNDLSLREALFLANEDPTTADTITFANNLSGGTIDLTLGQLKLTGGVTIDGGNDHVTVDAQGYSRVFDALYGTSTINGLTITGGYAGIGGAVKVGLSSGYSGADLTISNSTITNSQAAYGGGIAVDYGSSLQLTNSVVSGNYAYVIGGGIANQGKLTLTNSTVSDNGSGFIGGGIASDNTLTVIGSTLSDNQTGGAGPGVPNGYSYRGGGGLYNSGSATLLNTTISGNKGLRASGGGIYNSEDLTLTNVTLANNSADYGGGLSNAACGCGNVTIDDTTITGNAATIYGGGLYNAGGTLTLANSIVAGNGSSNQGSDISAYATITYSGVNLFSQSGIGRPGTDIYVSPSDLANVFASLTTIDPDGVPNSGDEFRAGTLGNNGGPVETVLIKQNGTAQNAGDNTALPPDPNNPDQLLPVDARGDLRVAGGTVDLGALEFQVPIVTVGTPAPLFISGRVTLDAGIAVSDPDSADLAGATVSISAGAQPGDVLSFDNGTNTETFGDGDTITAAYANGVLTLSGAAALADYQTALRQVQFSFAPGNGDPTAGGTDLTRSITWQVSDGFALSSTANATTTLTVQPPNAAPPAGTSADMITVRGSDGTYEIYDLGNNTVLAVHPLTQIAAPWQVLGLGNFSGSGTSDMLLRNTTTGAFEIVDVSNNKASAPILVGNVGLEWQVAGFGDFSGQPGETDMLARDINNGDFEVYNFRNNAVTFATDLGKVGLEVQVFGFGDFSGKANETDMLMRDVNTDNVELYELSNNAVTSVIQLGNLGSEWQFAGAGDFSGRPGETDMLARNINNGDFELYDFQNGTITLATDLGKVGLEWQVAGFGDFSGNPNETDMLMRNVNNGDFELYDIHNNGVTAAIPLGDVGLEWQAVGTAPYQLTASAPASAASDEAHMQTFQAGIDGWLTQAMQAGGTASQTWGAGTPMSVAPVAGTSVASGAGFAASGDLISGAAPAASLAIPSPLQTHTG